MGQRHQIYVIARVRRKNETTGHRRCVAAYHHQWCYGTLPPLAINRFLKLVRVHNNAEIVREELRAIDGKYSTNGEEPRIPDTPCPFTSTLLGLSFCVDLETQGPRYVSGMTLQQALLPASMDSWGGGMSLHKPPLRFSYHSVTFRR